MGDGYLFCIQYWIFKIHYSILLHFFPSFLKIACLYSRTFKKHTLTSANYIQELVTRVKQQDLLAMKMLYEQLAKEMLTTSFRITKNLEDSEDILQEAFLKSFQDINSLKEPAKYVGWLKRIVINKSLNSIKKKIRFDTIENIPEPLEEDDSSWYEDISFEKIRVHIQKLPEGSRQIFSLYLLEGYKHKEIAEILNISISTSKSQYQYALKLLKEMLSKFIV